MLWRSKYPIPRLRLWLLGLALALSACGAPPESRVALSEPGETAYDERLPGIWYAADEREATYLHITPRKQTAMFDVVGIWASAKQIDAPLFWVKATAHASEIDGVTYYTEFP